MGCQAGPHWPRWTDARARSVGACFVVWLADARHGGDQSLDDLNRNMATLTAQLRQVVGTNTQLDELSQRWLRIHAALSAVADSSRPATSAAPTAAGEARSGTAGGDAMEQ